MAPSIDFTQFRAEDVTGTKRVIRGVYTGPASYPAAGDPLAPGDVKLGAIDELHCTIAWDGGSNVRLLVYDPVLAVVHWFIPNTGAEVAGAQNLSAYTAFLEAVGR